MKLLVLYSSNSGSTYTVAKIIVSTLNQMAVDHQVFLKNAVEFMEQDLDEHDMLMLGSPSWFVDNKEGQPHEDMLKVLETISSKNLENKHYAVFGCGDRSYLNFCNAVDLMNEALKNTGSKKIGESLKIDSFYFDQEKNEQTAKDWAAAINSLLPVNSLF